MASHECGRKNEDSTGSSWVLTPGKELAGLVTLARVVNISMSSLENWITDELFEESSQFK